MISSILAASLLVLGLFLFVSGTVGILRFPDFYSRVHAMGKCDTLGALLMLGGLAAEQGVSLVSLKILLILGFIFLVNPVAAHALGRAAWVNELAPWEGSRPAGRPEPGAGEEER